MIELTPRERQVLGFLAAGVDGNRELAEALGVEDSTVRWHLESLRNKLGASSRTQILAFASRRGLVSWAAA